MNPLSFQAKAQAVFNNEIEALHRTQKKLDHHFDEACEKILACQGRVIVTGIGKSGHIANKIAATFASTGTPSFFVHPAEAQHGDLGMITAQDVILALSYSGKAPEVLALIPHAKRFKIPLICITNDLDSPLAKNSDICLLVDIDKEACPLNLAPTSSTTAMLVLGDALAVGLLNARGFHEENFAIFHPGGNLGKRLLVRVEDLMKTGEDIPVVSPETLLHETVLEISKKRLGMTVIAEKQKVLGVFTDGDLRRAFEKNIDFKKTPVKELLHGKPKALYVGELAAKAAQVMQQFKITALVILNPDETLAGVLHLHALLDSGVL